MNQPNYAEIEKSWTKLSEALPGREFSFWIRRETSGELYYMTLISDSLAVTELDPSASVSKALEFWGNATKQQEQRKAALLAELAEIDKAIAPETK